MLQSSPLDYHCANYVKKSANKKRDFSRFLFATNDVDLLYYLTNKIYNYGSQ